MILHRLFRRVPVVSFQQRVSFWLATAQPAQAAKKLSKKEETEDVTLAFYYRQLLRKTRCKPQNGMARFDTSHMNRMVKLTTNPQQAALLLQAFYNLKGNYTALSQTTIDHALLKYLQVNGDPSALIELFENHTFLSYFPHYNVTVNLLKAVEGDSEKLKAFVTVLKNRPLIKVNQEIVQELFRVTEGSEDLDIATEVLKVAEKAKVFDKNPGMFVEFVNKRGVGCDENTEKLFENARKTIDLEKVKEPKEVVDIGRFLIAAGDVSGSLLLVSKAFPTEDELAQQYFQTLLDKLTNIRSAETPNLEELDKILDEYTLLLSKKAQGAQTAAIHQQIQQIISSRKNPQQPEAPSTEAEQPAQTPEPTPETKDEK